MLTTDKSTVATLALHAVVTYLNLMYLNQFFMFFSGVTCSGICTNLPKLSHDLLQFQHFTLLESIQGEVI